MRKIVSVLSLTLLVTFAFAQDGWIQRTNFGGVGRHRASGCATATHGYIGLGHVNGNNFNISYSDWWEYDQASDSWTQKADFVIATYGVICFGTSTKAYAGGGVNLNGEFYEYNPQTNLWTQIPDCPGTPGDQTAFTVNDKGYVVFGALLYEYNPSTTTWTTKATAPVTFGTWCTSFGIGSSGYVRSGVNFYEYKPAINQWLVRSPCPSLSSNGSASMTKDGKGYIVSGYSGSLANVVPEVWEFNPGNNAWTRLSDFPGNSRRFTVGFSIGNRAYMGTGTNGINMNDFWELDQIISTDEINANEISVNVFPNPATELVRFNVVGNNFSAKTISLYDLNGSLIDQQTFNGSNVEIVRGDKAAGMYFYQIQSEGKTIKTGKLIFE
jgi:N-acetylneuraminic acid mutarotase